MDFFNVLTKLKDSSMDMVNAEADADYGAPGHGKPGDYGFGGRARNLPVTPRMAGGSMISAIAGNLANAGLKAAQPYIDSGVQSIASSIRGTGNIASR